MSTPTDAAAARAGHSVASAIRAGLEVWFPVVGSTVAWLAHLVALSSLARLGCDHGTARLAMHLITVGCLLVAAIATWLSARLVSGRAGSREGEERRSHRFLGLLGVLFGAVNLLLIVVEELDVVALGHGPCG